MVGYSLSWHGNVGSGNQFPDSSRISRHDNCAGAIRFANAPFWAIEPMALPKVPRSGRYILWVWQQGPEGISKHRVSGVQIQRSNRNTYFSVGNDYVFDPRGKYMSDLELIRWPKGQPRPRPEGSKPRVRRIRRKVNPTEQLLAPTAALPFDSRALEDRLVDRVTRAVQESIPVTLPDQRIADTLKEQWTRLSEQSRRMESELSRENAELRQRLQAVQDKKQADSGLSAEVAALKSMVSELRQQLQATVAETRADREASAKRESELSRERDAARAEVMQLQATLTLIVRERDLAVARLQKLAKPEQPPVQSAVNAAPAVKSTEQASSAPAPVAASPPKAPHTAAPGAKESASQMAPSTSVPTNPSAQPIQSAQPSSRTQSTPSTPPSSSAQPNQTSPPSVPPRVDKPASTIVQPSLPPTVLGLIQQARQARPGKPKQKRNRR